MHRARVAARDASWEPSLTQVGSGTHGVRQHRCAVGDGASRSGAVLSARPSTHPVCGRVRLLGAVQSTGVRVQEALQRGESTPSLTVNRSRRGSERVADGWSSAVLRPSRARPLQTLSA